MCVCECMWCDVCVCMCVGEGGGWTCACTCTHPCTGAPRSQDRFSGVEVADGIATHGARNQSWIDQILNTQNLDRLVQSTTQEPQSGMGSRQNEPWISKASLISYIHELQVQ